MAAGSRPFAGDSAADLMSAILRDAPAPLCDRRTELPLDIDRILARCLAKNRDDRYLTAKDLCRDLEGVRKEMNNSAQSGRSTPSAASNLPLPERPSLAVLPFVNLSGDPEQDYFAAGLWTDINADLVKVSGLFLISQTSTGLYKDRSTTPRQVGSELGVRYVLEGTVRKAGKQVRVTARLVDAQTGEPLWAERYDSKIDDLFELQDEINQNIVEALDVKLIHGESHRVLQRSMKDPKARDTYYRALAAVFTLRREDLAAARLLLDEVAGLEPEAPHAHVFSAFSHYFEAILDYSDNREASLELALESADRAIALDDPSGFAHMIRGMVLLLRRDHDGSMGAADKAVLDRPNCPWAYALKGAIYNYAGRPGEAIELAKQAIRHTPDSAGVPRRAGHRPLPCRAARRGRRRGAKHDRHRAGHARSSRRVGCSAGRFGRCRGCRARAESDSPTQVRLLALQVCRESALQRPFGADRSSRRSEHCRSLVEVDSQAGN